MHVRFTKSEKAILKFWVKIAKCLLLVYLARHFTLFYHLRVENCISFFKKAVIYIFITEENIFLVPSLFLNKSWGKNLYENSDLISSATAVQLQINHMFNYFYVIKKV